MTDPTASILNYDLSHLTQQQIEHLHALKNIAQALHLREYLEKRKGSTHA